VSNSEQRTRSGDRSDVLSLPVSEDRPGRLWADDEFTMPEDNFAVDPAGAVPNLGFIWAAVGRGIRLWGTLAMLGLLLGCGLYVKFPAPAEAETTLLMANVPDTTAGTTIISDQAIVMSRTAAGAVIKHLGLHEPVAALLSHYTAVEQSGQVLAITVKASSGALAIREANALANELLSFQATMLTGQRQLTDDALQHELTADQQNVRSLTSRINKLSALPYTSAVHAQIANLQAQRIEARNALAALEPTLNGEEATGLAANEAVIQGSQVLDKAALVKQSKKRRLLLFVGGSLMAGLVIGMGLVVLRALITDRLRRRDDVARVLGAPVRLSVGSVKLSRWRRGLAVADDPSIRQIIAHLHGIVIQRSSATRSLAVIPVDDVRISALCIVALAKSLADGGLRVMLADLCPGAPAARLAGAGESGIQQVTIDGALVNLAVPEAEDVAPLGPLSRSRQSTTMSYLVAAAESADVLLTLASIDPATGGDYLPGWATEAVAIVTAGGPSAARVYAVGELVRLTGTPVISAVLVGADKSDQSLGVTRRSSSVPGRVDV
jgi:capsular polysaccharide biosynthesis protein